VVVALSYLPDIAAQVLSMVGLVDWSASCHSIVLAAPASCIIAAILHWMFRIRWRRGLLVAFISILLHDVADVLAGGHRLLLWWPISDHLVSFAPHETDLGMTHEVLIFGGAFVTLLAIRWPWLQRRNRSPRQHERSADRSECFSRPVWISGGITALILFSVLATSYLRNLRERQLQLAWTMINEKQCVSVLGLLDQAERWPSTARSGRIDYARAEACANLGDRKKAEEYYLRSYRADPSYFWTLADLAAFYASSDEPLEIRRRRTAPYLRRLASEFADEKAWPRCLARLKRKLSDPFTRPSAAPTDTNH
jgi:hypothetical protein